jgi:hypothetical protein
MSVDMFASKSTVEILENYVADTAYQHIIINIVSHRSI